jgi:3-oxoacyl-[acyl-carrier-protein] synthase III
MLFVHGVGHFRPHNEIDNSFLESLGIGTSEDWILRRVGITSRRTVLPLSYILETRNADPYKAYELASHTNAQSSVEAAKMALDRAGLKRESIGMVIAGGCSPQYTTPAESCTVAAELGINCAAFDVNSGCSSFAAQMHLLSSMDAKQLPDYILIVNPENITRTVDYNDRTTAVLWGDATAATIVSPRVPSNLRVKFSLIGSDPSGWNKVTIPPGKHFQQDGSAVQAFAIKRMVKVISELREHAESDASRLFFIGHQANLRMLRTVSEKADIAPERHLYNVDRFGNCGAAGAPSVLSEHWGDFEYGDEIALVTVGAGLSWGGVLFQATGGQHLI